jgi:hypothetical protein
MYTHRFTNAHKQILCNEYFQKTKPIYLKVEEIIIGISLLTGTSPTIRRTTLSNLKINQEKIQTLMPNQRFNNNDIMRASVPSGRTPHDSTDTPRASAPYSSLSARLPHPLPSCLVTPASTLSLCSPAPPHPLRYCVTSCSPARRTRAPGHCHPSLCDLHAIRDEGDGGDSGEVDESFSGSEPSSSSSRSECSSSSSSSGYEPSSSSSFSFSGSEGRGGG